MPNMTATQITKAIVKATGSIFGEAEQRTYQNSLLGRLIANEPALFRNLSILKQSDEQPTKAQLFTRNKVASGTAKSAAHSGAFLDTMEKDITYQKRTQTFGVSYKQAANNNFNVDEVIQQGIATAVKNLYEDITAVAVAYLDTYRTQVATDSVVAFDGIGFKFDNPASEADFIFDNIAAALRKNKYFPLFDVVGDQPNFKQFRRIAAQGSGNSTNLSYTIPGIDYVVEEQITNSASGQAYAWQKGMVALSTWNERLNRQGFGDPESNQGFFTTIQDPVFGLLHDVHVTRGVADTSASSGNTQDVVDQWEITTIFTLQHAFLSTANETPIFKFVQG